MSATGELKARVAAYFNERACLCGPTDQRPERQLVGSLSLLLCLNCGGFVLKDRRPGDGR